MKAKILGIMLLVFLVGSHTALGQRPGVKRIVKKAVMGKKQSPKRNNMRAKSMKQNKSQQNAQRKKNQQSTGTKGNRNTRSQQANTQRKGAAVKLVKALQLKGNLVAEIMLVEVNAFEVSEEGVLSPKPGYHMGFHKTKKIYIIKPVDTKIDVMALQNETKEIAPNVTMSCLGCDACHIVDVPKNDSSGGRTYSCQGSCVGFGCNEFVTITPSIEVQPIDP